MRFVVICLLAGLGGLWDGPAWLAWAGFAGATYGAADLLWQLRKRSRQPEAEREPLDWWRR
jgi:hypothetical protein